MFAACSGNAALNDCIALYAAELAGGSMFNWRCDKNLTPYNKPNGGAARHAAATRMRGQRSSKSVRRPIIRPGGASGVRREEVVRRGRTERVASLQSAKPSAEGLRDGVP